MKNSTDFRATSIVKDLLLSRISHAGQNLSLSMTRRVFLMGSATALLRPSIASADEDSPRLEIKSAGKGFTLSYRTSDANPRVWTLLPKMFQGNTKLKVQPRLKTGLVTETTSIEFDGPSLHGVGKRVKVEATLSRVNGAWTIQNRFHLEPQPGSRMDLVDWLDGERSQAYPHTAQTYRVGDRYRLSVEGQTARLRWDKFLTVEMLDAGGIVYSDSGHSTDRPVDPPGDGRYGFVADSVEMSARAEASEALVRMEPSAKELPSTALTFSGVSEIYLGKTNTGQNLKLELDQSELAEVRNGASVAIEAYETAGRRSGILTVNGSGTLVIGSSDGGLDTRLHLEAIGLVGRIGELAESLVFGAKLARKTFEIADTEHEPENGFGMNVGTLAVKVAGTGEPVIASFSKGQTGSLVFPAKLLRAHIPVEGASSADLRFYDTDIDIVIGRRHDRSAASKDEQAGSNPQVPKDEAGAIVPDCTAALEIGKTQRLSTSLARAELHLSRRVDLFDLKFRFQNYELCVEDGVSHLIPRWDFVACDPTSAAPRRVAIFSPQHVQEEAFFYKREPNDEPKTLTGEDLATDPNDPNYIRPIKAFKDTDLAKTRVARPTRLVFEEVDAAASAMRETKISIEMITDWTDLALVVHKRALPRSASLEDQLDVVGITKSTPRDKARSLILRSVTEPTEWETGVEAVTGLIFSPDASGKFVTPRNAPRGHRAPVWATRLEMTTQTAVRAIYARGLDDRFLQNLVSEDPDYLPFITSLNARDRREIVAMTSIYGLAALRRLIPAMDGTYFRDDPKGMVIRPDGIETYKYLSSEQEDYQQYLNPKLPGPLMVFQEGIMMPKPFVDFKLMMSTLRASVHLRWEGEPAAPLATDPFFQAAFNIESYVHETTYGRDVLVQVTYKGFLFPLGHRAAYIRLSERTMLPSGDNPHKLYPVGKLTQRHFIVVRKPTKAYPALNQPNASRRFPAEQVEMITTVTPDLEPPSESIDLSVFGVPEIIAEREKRPLQGARVFWPRTSKSVGSEVEFDYRLNGDATPARSKLIFVDNTAAHFPKMMAALIEGYNAGGLDKAPDANTVFHDGVDRLYAVTSRVGETSFKTETWNMQAEGRVNGGGGLANYEMDALMEGKDQPPFYPVVETARIHMQSVDRMLGRPQGPITVRFNEDLYVKHAFEGVRNPSEIYLEVVAPVIKLDFTNQGDSSGGIAKPNATLAAISRRIGLVGGKVVQEEPPSSKATFENSRSATSVKFDFGSAKAGEFDPFEFLPDGKILGILEIRDLVKAVAIVAAPHLKEVYEFGGAAAAAIRDKLIEIMPVLSTAIRRSITAADEAIKEFLPGEINTSDLYPDLIDQLNDVADKCDEVHKIAQSVATSDDAQKIAEALGPSLTGLYAEGKTLVSTIEGVIDNPTPAIVGETIEQFQAIKRTIRAAIKDLDPKAIFAQFKDEAFKLVCDQLIEDDTFELLFGPAAYEGNDRPIFLFPEPSSSNSAQSDQGDAALNNKERKAMLDRACLEMLEYPEQVLPNLQRSLFYEVYGRVTSQLLLELKKLDLGVPDLLLWSRRKLAEALSGVLKQGFVAGRLQLVDDTTWAIVKVVEAELTKPIDLTEPEADFRKRVDQVKAKSAPIIQGFIGAVRSESNRVAAEQLTRLEDIKKAEIKALEAKTQELKEAAEAELARLAAVYAKYEHVAKAAAAIAKKVEEIDDPKVIVNQVIAAVETELDARVKALEAEVKARAEKLRDDLIAKALGTALRLFDQLAQSARAKAIADAVQGKAADLCFAGAGKTSGIYQTVVSIISLVPAGDLLQATTTASEALKTIKPPVALSEDIRTQIEVQISAINRSLNRFADDCQNFVRIQLHLDRVVGSEEEINICSDPKSYFEPIEQAYDMRRSATATLGDVFDGLDQLRQTVESIDEAAEIERIVDDVVVPKLITALIDISALDKIAEAAFEYLPPTFLDDATEIKKELQAVQTEAKKRAAKLEESAQFFVNDVDARAKGELKKLSNSVSDFIAQQEKELIARLLQGAVIGSKTAQKLAVASATVVRDLTSLLATVLYTPANDALTTVIGLLKNTVGGDSTISQVRAVLSEPAIADLEKAQMLVGDELMAIKAINTAASGFLTTPSISTAEAIVLKVEALKQDGEFKPLGLVAAVEIVGRMVEALGRGQLDQLFDFDAVKDLLLEAISDLFPARVVQSYDWETSVGAFPASSPIFEIDRALEVGKPKEYGAIVPQNKKGEKHDLVLEAGIDINLITGKRSIVAKGRLRPFKIHLLGSAIDLATIGFKGMEVISVNGAKPTFKADIAEVEIGQALSFIEALAPFFGPKPDDGPYVRLNISPLGVLAGYKFSAPVIVVGAVFFSGVAIQIEMVLPFEDQQATFSFAFASRKKPFLVSVPPYGGGGFVGLLATPKGVVGFEIQVEFGAVVPIEFGPLKAEGRVTAGIYLMSRPGTRIIEGFVRAVGEGNIACFSIFVCLEVTIRQENGGNVTGSASFTFSFKAGFIEVSYGFTAAYAVQGGGSPESDRNNLRENSAFDTGRTVNAVLATYRSKLPDRRTDWSNYKSHFGNPSAEE